LLAALDGHLEGDLRTTCRSGIVVPDTTQGLPNIEAVSREIPVRRSARELQIADLLTFIKPSESTTSSG